MKNLMKYVNTLLVFSVILCGCQRKAPPQADPAPAPIVEAAKPKTPEIPAFPKSTFEATSRVIALGDVHGDFAAMSSALRAAGVINEAGDWTGGDATLVQTGDLLDRGDDEQQIVDFFEALKPQVKAAGGKLIMLNGNHEVMNVAGDLRYVTPGGFADFADVEGLDLSSPVLQRVPEAARPRMAAFMPGGPYAKVLATKLVIAKVGDSAFVHGGVLPHHVEYGIDAINEQTAGWMRGERDAPDVLSNDDAPIWTRSYSQGAADCATLDKALAAMDVARIVVGHTVQKSGVTSACDDKVWRIDVGMAAHYGGKPAVLEITKAGVKVIAAE